MAILDFLMNPVWRKIKKLPGDLKSEIARVLAVYGQSLGAVQLVLIEPRKSLFDALFKEGFCPNSVTQEGASPEQLLAMRNEAVIALTKQRDESGVRLDGFRYMPPKVVHEMVNLIAHCQMEPGSGPPKNYRYLDSSMYSSDTAEAGDQLLVRWAAILGIPDHKTKVFQGTVEERTGFRDDWDRLIRIGLTHVAEGWSNPPLDSLYSMVEAMCKALFPLPSHGNFILVITNLLRKAAPLPP